MNVLRGSPAWRACLICFFLQTQLGWAHLPELFGREYIRLEGPLQVPAGEITAADTAKLYVEAVEGDITGKVLRARGGLPVVPE